MRFNFFRARKAQSATEYLMTYGWAILAIAIVGALLYTQVFSSKKCAEGATGFAISGTVYPDGNEYAIDPATGNLDILLKNNVGKSVTLVSVACTDSAGTATTVADTTVIADGLSVPVNLAACVAAPGATGTCYAVPIVVTYQTSAGISLKAAGTLNGKY
ncbi:MAG: hypothetical protein U9Q92_05200 [archaeon]|nr:hypothetical protein [archaeon]